MMDMPVPLTVTTLGSFAVARAQQQLSGGNWNRRKVCTLFKLLVSADQHRLHREQIQEILWPSSTSEQAASSFGKAVYLLRRALDPDLTNGKNLSTYLALSHEALFLVPENFQIDADLFESSVKSAQAKLLAHKESVQDQQILSEVDQALYLYRADYLPEDLYEDWSQKRRDRLRRLRFWLLENAATLAIAQGSGLRACEYLQTLLNHEPTDEQTHRLLMLVYARMGHRTEALNQFQGLQAILRSELNASPMSETLSLFRDIQRGRIPVDLALSQAAFEISPPSVIDSAKDILPPESTLVANRISPPEGDLSPVFTSISQISLVGRAAEIQRLQELYTQSCQGQQHICFISGEPGIGKTRLARDFTSWVQETQRTQVLWGYCYEMSTALPYQPLVDAIETQARNSTAQQLALMLGDYARDLAKIVSEIRTKLPSLSSSGAHEAEVERYNLYNAFAYYFRQLASERPLVIVLDDIQWADVATFQLLSYLTSRVYYQNRASSPVPFYILLYRAEEIHEKHPLRDLIATFSRLNNLQEIHLKRLDESAVQQLLTNTIGSPPSPVFTEQIYEHTEGNPFFIGQILLSLIQEGKVKKDGEHWQVAVDASELTLPQSVRMLIERRLLNLSPAGRTTLMTAAILGRQFNSLLLSQACNLPEDAVAQHVDDAIQLHILLSIQESLQSGDQQSFSLYPADLTFTHDKIREVLYQGLNPLRRRSLHRNVAHAIESLYRPDLTSYYSSLALHYQMAEVYPSAIEYYLKASYQASGVYAFHDAASYMERALALLMGNEERQQRAEILQRLASEVYLYLGLTDKSIESGQVACALWRALGNPLKEAEAQLDVAFSQHWQGQETKSLLSIQRALQCLPQEERVLRTKAHCQWGMSAIIMGDTETALMQFQYVDDLQAQIAENNPFIDVVLLWSRSWYAFLTGTAAEMLAYAQQGAELCRIYHRSGWEPMLTYTVAWAFMFQGNFVEGERIAQESLETAQRIHAVGAQSWAFLVQMLLAIRSSQWERAQQCSDSALAIAPMLGDADLQARILWSRSILAGRLNNWEQALSDISEALHLSEQSAVPSMFSPHFLLQAATAYFHTNNTQSAQLYLEQSLSLAQQRHYRHLPALAHRLQAQILLAKGDLHRAQVCFQQALNELEALNDTVEHARTLELSIQFYLSPQPRSS